MNEILSVSEDARRVLKAAVEVARRMGHEFVGLGHVLLAMIRNDGKVPPAPAPLFRAAFFAQLRHEIEARAPAPEPTTPDPSTPLPATPAHRMMMEIAVKQARWFGGSSVTPAHLLLGMLEVPDSVVRLVLRACGADVGKLFGELEELLGGRTAPAPGAGNVAEEKALAESMKKPPAEISYGGITVRVVFQSSKTVPIAAADGALLGHRTTYQYTVLPPAAGGKLPPFPVICPPAPGEVRKSVSWGLSPDGRELSGEVIDEKVRDEPPPAQAGPEPTYSRMSYSSEAGCGGSWVTKLTLVPGGALTEAEWTSRVAPPAGYSRAVSTRREVSMSKPSRLEFEFHDYPDAGSKETA